MTDSPQTQNQMPDCSELTNLPGNIKDCMQLFGILLKNRADDKKTMEDNQRILKRIEVALKGDPEYSAEPGIVGQLKIVYSKLDSFEKRLKVVEAVYMVFGGVIVVGGAVLAILSTFHVTLKI
jgi:hypothetical protein